MSWRREVAAASTIAGAVVALYWRVIRLWWNHDDAWILRLTHDHSLADAFTERDFWPQKLFTPMLNAGFEAGLVAFGLEPSRWFVMQLGLATFAALAIYAALRLWFTMPAALAGALLVVAAVPLAALVPQLSGLHYFKALFFGALSIILYVHALRRARPWLAIASAGAYLVAMLSRETIVPLLALLLLLPERDWRTRAKYAIAHAVAAALYLAWRSMVLGVFVGGYGWAIGRDEWPALLLSLPRKLFEASTGAGFVAGMTLIAIMAIGVAIALRSRRALLLFVLAFVLAILPVIPVSKEMQLRYALMPWLVWTIAFVAGADLVRRRYAAAGSALLVASMLLALVTNRLEWTREYARILRMSDEARFFVDLDVNGVLRRPTVPPAAMAELVWLKSSRFGKPVGASWFYDDLYLCSADLRQKQTYEYHAVQRTIVDVSASQAAVRERHCGGIREDAPLTVSFDYRENGTLFWRFGPYRNGKWRVVIANGVQAFDVKAADGFRLPGIPGLTLRVRYDSPEGWTTYSPELALDFVNRPRFEWSRQEVN